MHRKPPDISVWYASCTEADRKRLQREVNTAQRIIGHPLPSLDSIYNSCYSNRARNIAQDSLHPGHHLFNLLPSGRCYRCIKTRTNRLKNSFYLRAITLLNVNMH